MMTTTQAAIRVELSDRLVGELPRFFGGRLAAFRELFQNAYRAGAKNVRLTLEGQTLTVEDDGEGCPSPKLLLCAGETGWDEDRVVEPAGLGFFSLLGMDVSASVTVESHGWRVVLLPDEVLARKLVVPTPGTVTRGLRLVMLLVEPNPERDLAEARAYYPMNVTLNGNELPVARLVGEPRIETPVGSVHLSSRPYTGSHCAIWEHRPVMGETFSKALHKAAQGSIQEGILRSFKLEWVAEMTCGVTPKLPDRNDLQQSPELVRAAATILATIESHFLARARSIVASWPETIRVTHSMTGYAMPEWLVRTQMGDAILKALGWARIQTPNWGDPNIYYADDNEGWRHEPYLIMAYTRTFVRVADENVAHSMNNAIALGASLPWAVHDEDAPDALTLRIIGVKGPTTSWVQLADEIRVGPHVLPFLLDEDGAEGGHVVVACSAENAVRAVMGGSVLLGGFEADYGDVLTGFIACHDYDTLTSSWVVYKGSDPYVDWREVKHDLVQQLTEDHLPKLAEARAAHHTLVCAQDDLKDLAERAQRLAGTEAFRTDAGLKMARVGIHHAQRRLERRLERAAKQACLPA